MSNFVNQCLYTAAKSFVNSPDVKGNGMFKAFCDEVLRNSHKLDELYAILNDHESKKVLEWAVKYRFLAFFTQSRDIANKLCPPIMTAADWESMKAKAAKLKEVNLKGNYEMDVVENYILDGYNLPGICEVKPTDFVFDFGAFNGNSSIVFSRLALEGRVFAFEPNPKTQEVLKDNLKAMSCTNVEIVPFGVGSKAEKVKFKLAGAASLVTPNGDVDVEITTIDKFVKDNKISKVDFLKFDIEGLEEQALQGARWTIGHFRPKIAISMYHKPNDFTILPFLIKDMGFWYNFYLRHNAITPGEIVLYCEPMHRKGGM